MQDFFSTNQEPHLLVKGKDPAIKQVKSGVAPAWLGQKLAFIAVFFWINIGTPALDDASSKNYSAVVLLTVIGHSITKSLLFYFLFTEIQLCLPAHGCFGN